MTKRVIPPPEPYISLRKGVVYIKKETTFGIKEGPVLAVPYSGDFFPAQKAVIIDFGDRACVQVSGYMKYPRGVRSTRFNLRNYTESYRPCPDWLKPLLREAGYTEEIEE